nr:MAG TPA: hypothetical protein [Caudoviricetes sp.]DAE55457.1 MAG TPA: hypothetical protein [Caudoviricetes sp.]DAN76412.1 MAG TPA: hypothetical protein [Caudoviricetes sp.]
MNRKKADTLQPFGIFSINLLYHKREAKSE